MPTLKALRLKNVVSYDHAVFPLDRNGITCVYGRNHDSSPDNQKSNGAGKSLPFTMLAELLTDESPLINARDAVKDGFGREGATVTLDWDDYRLTKSMPGRSLKLDLFKNVKGDWKPSKTRTNEYVWSRMAELLPISNGEFYSLYYVDSSRQSTLQRGSHADRLKLFSRMFNLEAYDLMHAEAKSRLKDLKLVEARLGEVLNQITVLDKSVDLELAEEGERLNELRARQKKLSAKRQEAATLLSLANLWHSQSGNMDSLNEFLDKQASSFGVRQTTDIFDKAGLRELISAIADGEKEIRKALKAATSAQEAVAEHKWRVKRCQELEAELRDWLKAKNPKAALREAVDQAEQFQDQLSEMDSGIRDLERRLSKLDVGDEPTAARELIDEELDDAPTDPDELLPFCQSWVSDERAKYELARNAHDKFTQVFSKCDSGECPTCHQQIDADTLDDIGARLKKSVDKAKKRLDTAKSVLAAADKWCEWAKSSTIKADLDQQLEEARSGYESYYHQGYAALDFEHPDPPRRLMKQLDEYLKVKAAMDSDGVPEAADCDTDKLTTRLSRYQKGRHCAETLLPVIGQLAKAKEVGAHEYDVDQLEAGLKQADKKLRSLMDEIPTLSQQVSIAQNTLRQLQQLEEKKAELEDQLIDAPVLRALEVAYGQKGMKNLAIQRACQLIESNLNLHAPLLFSERVRFSMEVTETKLNIWITRRYKGESSTVDVRRLSGAESRQFNLLMPMAIRPLIPARRRLNLMILDEPTANMDPPAVDLIVNRFLPKLQELVPHVIVISPNALPIDDPSVEYWNVMRKDGKSTVEIGKGRHAKPQ
jgi:DNA repair exonuclease SbcCD ATPase subunit